MQETIKRTSMQILRIWNPTMYDCECDEYSSNHAKYAVDKAVVACKDRSTIN